MKIKICHDLGNTGGMGTYIVDILLRHRTFLKEVEGNEFNLLVFQCLWRVLGPDL